MMAVFCKSPIGLDWGLAVIWACGSAWGRWPVIVKKDAAGWAFNIIKLAAIGHSKKKPDGKRQDGQADDNQKRQYFHGIRLHPMKWENPDC